MGCKVTNVAGSASCTCRVTITGTLRRRTSLLTKSKATLLETTAENKELKELKPKTSEENVVKLRESKDALTLSDAKKKTLSCVELKTDFKNEQKQASVAPKIETPINSLQEIAETNPQKSNEINEKSSGEKREIKSAEQTKDENQGNLDKLKNGDSKNSEIKRSTQLKEELEKATKDSEVAKTKEDI